MNLGLQWNKPSRSSQRTETWFFFFFPTNETRCSGPCPVRLSSRRVSVLHAFTQITILQCTRQITNPNKISTILKHLDTDFYSVRVLLLNLSRAVVPIKPPKMISKVDQLELNTLLTGRPQTGSTSQWLHTQPQHCSSEHQLGEQHEVYRKVCHWGPPLDRQHLLMGQESSQASELRGARVRVLTVSSFCRGTTESILTSCITVKPAPHHAARPCIVRAAETIAGTPLQTHHPQDTTQTQLTAPVEPANPPSLQPANHCIASSVCCFQGGDRSLWAKTSRPNYLLGCLKAEHQCYSLFWLLFLGEMVTVASLE